MRVARIGLIVLSIAALSLSAFASDTTPTPTTPADQTNPSGTPAAQQPANAPPSGPQSPPNPAPTPTAPTVGPMQIKVGPDTVIRFGLLLQPQLDLAQSVNAAGQTTTSQNLLLRRTRFIVSGQATKKAFFFFQTENSRLGNAATNTAGVTTKTIATGFQTIDAVIEYRFSRPFNLWGGLIYIPTSREALKSSSSQFFIDQNTYAYTATGALQGTGGRDTGFMARGFFANDRFEYRAGVFSGARNAATTSHPAGNNPFRWIARGQWEFFDTEPYTLPAYPGSYYGAKKVVALGAAWDQQNSYKGPTADLFWDLPTSFGNTLGTLQYMHLDGGKVAPNLGRSNIFVVDAGAFFKTFHRIGPWLRFEDQKYADPNKAKDVKRYLAGLNWMPYLSNFNIKAAYQHTDPDTGRKLNEYILQMQLFIY